MTDDRQLMLDFPRPLIFERLPSFAADYKCVNAPHCRHPAETPYGLCENCQSEQNAKKIYERRFER